MSLLAATPLARCPRRLPRFEQGFSLLLRAVAIFASQAMLCPTKQPVPVVRQIFEPRVRTCRHLYRMSTCNAYCAGQPHAQHTTVSFASPIARLARHASHSTPRTARTQRLQASHSHAARLAQHASYAASPAQLRYASRSSVRPLSIDSVEAFIRRSMVCHLLSPFLSPCHLSLRYSCTSRFY